MHCARLFVRSPAHRFRAVTDPAAGHLIERDLEDQLRRKRDVGLVALAVAVPARGRLVRCAAGESRSARIRLQPRRAAPAFGGGERAAEADVVQQARVVVEPEQQAADAIVCRPRRSENRRRRSRPCRIFLTFTAASVFPLVYGRSSALGDDPVERPADAREPRVDTSPGRRVPGSGAASRRRETRRRSASSRIRRSR